MPYIATSARPTAPHRLEQQRLRGRLGHGKGGTLLSRLGAARGPRRLEQRFRGLLTVDYGMERL